MASAVIRAIDPITGEVFTRKTARTYHAAIVATNPASGAVETLTWCGRPDLALSQLDRAVRGTLDNWRGPRPDARLAIVEVEECPEPVAPVRDEIELIASRAALHASAAALAVADVVVAVADAGRAPLPFAWIHDAVADATRDRHVVDRAFASGLLTVDQHAAKRDAIRVRLRSAVSIANDFARVPVVVAFPDVAMHDATLTDAGVAFVRVCHATHDGVCGFISGPAFRSRLPFAGAVAAVSHAIDPAAVVRLPGERVAPSGSGRVARAVCLPTIADV